jgi:hypothetical protein
MGGSEADIFIAKSYLYRYKKEALIVTSVVIFIVLLIIIYILWSAKGSKIQVQTPPIVNIN